MARGDIILADLPVPLGGRGHEQTGQRPTLIVHDDPALSTVMIVPFTSRFGALRFPHTVRVEPSKENGLHYPSILVVFQLRALDRRRLRGRIGRLESDLLEDVDSELRRMLSL